MLDNELQPKYCFRRSTANLDANQPQISRECYSNRMSTTVIDAAPLRKRGLAPKIRKLAVRYPELSKSEIARKVGCTADNVSQVLQRFLGPSSLDDLRDYQENQADIFDSVAQRLLESVTEDKINKTPAVQAITGAAILIDKARLVRGQATGINVNVLLDAVQAIRARER